ncbi:AAA family ATPase [Streptomyces tanashiensis]|uniref:AAA family ATPase n=1 Tax=Streptomyces tanashiensis TaxID=67367 RepID=A0ABY6R7X5_9ACTN|nr:AAA family ATPase [Streptomyces tanashiensis]UZX26117.1 AAA family ATPase [Streptomyces tanashiensis]
MRSPLLDELPADAAAAVVRLLGDTHQLAAVEVRGALRLIAGAGGAAALDQLHGFRAAGEADASLTLRVSNDHRTAEPFTAQPHRTSH